MKQRIEEEKMLMPRMYRFMGNAIAKRLANSPLTPNQVTFLGIFVGLAAAWAIVKGDPDWMLVAAILLQVNVVLDYVDGSLAHLKGMGSVLGDWLDKNAGIGVDFTIFLAIALNLHFKGLPEDSWLPAWQWLHADSGGIMWMLAFLSLSWRFLTMQTKFTFQATGFFESTVKERSYGPLVQGVLLFLPTRYFFLLCLSLGIALNQLPALLLFIACYGAAACGGLWVIAYCKIAKHEHARREAQSMD